MVTDDIGLPKLLLIEYLYSGPWSLWCQQVISIIRTGALLTAARRIKRLAAIMPIYPLTPCLSACSPLSALHSSWIFSCSPQAQDSSHKPSIWPDLTSGLRPELWHHSTVISYHANHGTADWLGGLSAMGSCDLSLQLGELTAFSCAALIGLLNRNAPWDGRSLSLVDTQGKVW